MIPSTMRLKRSLELVVVQPFWSCVQRCAELLSLVYSGQPAQELGWRHPVSRWERAPEGRQQLLVLGLVF